MCPTIQDLVNKLGPGLPRVRCCRMISMRLPASSDGASVHKIVLQSDEDNLGTHHVAPKRCNHSLSDNLLSMATTRG